MQREWRKPPIELLQLQRQQQQEEEEEGKLKSQDKRGAQGAKRPVRLLRPLSDPRTVQLEHAKLLRSLESGEGAVQEGEEAEPGQREPGEAVQEAENEVPKEEDEREKRKNGQGGTEKTTRQGKHISKSKSEVPPAKQREKMREK